MPRGVKATAEIAQEMNIVGQAAVEAMMARDLNAHLASKGIDDEEQAGIRKIKGLGATSTRASKDAEMMVTIYHAYDGRAKEVPKYQVPRLCTRLFDPSDEVPEEYWNKPVWSYDEDFPAEDTADYDYQCRLSPKSEFAVEMKAAGLAAVCRKRLVHGGFATQFEADEHFRKKHARRWAAYQRFLTKNSADQGTNAIVAAVQAMQALATSSANKE